MPTLSDIIKQMGNPLQGAVATQATTPTSTSQLQQRLATQKGQLPATLPQRENLLETGAKEVAAEQSQAAQRAVGQEQAALTSEAAKQQQDISMAQAAQAQDVKMNLQGYQQKINQITSSLAKEKRKLSLQQDRANAEQVAFAARLANERYIQELQRAGTIERLGNENTFKEKAMETELGASKDILIKHLATLDIQAASDRDFEKAMSNISLDEWLRIAKSEAKAKNAQAIASGVTKVVEGGAKGYETYKNRPISSNPESMDPDSSSFVGPPRK